MSRLPSLAFSVVVGVFCATVAILLTNLYGVSDTKVFAQPVTYTIRPTWETDIVLINNPQNARDGSEASKAGGAWGRVCKSSCLEPVVATATWTRIPGGYRPIQLDIRWQASSSAGLYGNDTAKFTAKIEVDFGSGWNFVEEYAWFGDSGTCSSTPNDIRCPSHLTTIPLLLTQQPDKIKVKVTGRVEFLHCDNCILRVSNITGTASVYDIRVTADQCHIPTGETTASDGWWDQDGTVHKFKQTLIPPNPDVNFDGRRVTEQDPGGGGPDTCYFPVAAASGRSPWISITGGLWTVSAGNIWAWDHVGWGWGNVNYYRANGRAPCQTTIPQRMVIDCGSGQVAYVTTTLAAGFDDFFVWSERAGQREQHIWP
jgi:hypothetical protein